MNMTDLAYAQAAYHAALEQTGRDTILTVIIRNV